MPAEGKIDKILADHEKRLSRLEDLFKQAKPHVKPLKPKTLPEHTLSLRGAGFFAQPRTAPEVREKLAASYHCEVDRVDTALRRLAAGKEFRKSTKKVKGRKYLAYVR